MTYDGFSVPFIHSDFPVSGFVDSSWEKCKKVSISKYWDAERAPASRQFSVQALWSERCLYIRFETGRNEDMIMAEKPKTDRKTIGLWERDVCEVFVAPDARELRRYFEFEVAPTGEWLDLAIGMRGEERLTEWEYHSGMEAAARIEERRVLMSIKIPWAAFGSKPNAGDVWRGNIFRCVGKGPDRGYLAWRPTMTETPNFHVPKAFGRLIFDN